MPAHAADLRAQFNGVTSAVSTATSAAQSNAAQAAALAQQSQQSLAATMRAIQAMQAVQAAARSTALSKSSSVPNGLVSGGLVPDSGLAAPGVANPVTTWANLATPLQSTSGGQTTVTIVQTAANAIANWSSFNVGKGTVVDFNQQGNQNWIVLNRVTGSAVPSRILGQIKADGQVLLVNQNGIMFGGSSQVNVNTLIASTLDVTLSGQTGSASNTAFLQNGLYSNAVPSGNTGAGAAVFSQVGGGAAVTVRPGAVLDTTHDLDATGDGGYVALLGAAVTSQGTITTQNGQIILAADTRSVTLIAPPQGPGIVGALTARRVLSTSGGPVTVGMNGLLASGDGAVTLAGGQIQDLGAIEATTSTTRPGSIQLTGAGNVVLGPASITAILPDETSGTLPASTAAGAQIITADGITASYLVPRIAIQGADVDVQGNGAGLGGALIKAPGAALSITAGENSGTVLVEAGSTIDLSGIAGVALPVSVNFITFSNDNPTGLITAANVADTPLASSLIGQSVTIDARLSGTRADGLQWVGSPILDAVNNVGDIPVTLDQVLTPGGSFTASGKNVIQEPGSVINVSGGSVNYLGSAVPVTRLLGANGRVYSIGSADPTIAYVGVVSGFTVDHAHWGVTETFADPLLAATRFQAGYVAGASAGSVSVTALNPILEGSIVADVVAGDRQRALAGSANVAPSDQMPTGAALSITFPNNVNSYTVVLEPQADAGPDPYGLIAGGFSFSTASAWTPTLANGTPGIATSGTFPIFSDVLTSDQFNTVSIKGGNQLSVAADATLAVRPGGSITLDGVAAIDGTLNAPAGKISLTGFTYADGSLTQPLSSLPVPAVVIGSDAVLDVRGLWVNDSGQTSAATQGAGFVNGGSVSITTFAASKPAGSENNGTPVFADATQSIVLSPGSVIDVSGGGYVGFTGKLQIGSDGLPAGKGGSVTLMTYASGSAVANGGAWSGFDPTASPSFNVVPTFQAGNVPDQANVSLGGAIYAQGFDGGGTFSLQAPTVTIDSATTRVTSYLSSASAAAVLGAAPTAVFAVPGASGPASGEIVVPTSFFSNGFSQYTLTSTYGSTTVTAGTQAVLRGASLLPASGETQIPTGAMVRSFAPSGFQPDGLRRPVSLTLAENAFTLDSGDPVSSQAGVVIESAASIVADPQAAVSMVAGGPVTVLGSITAHGGVINLVNDPNFTSTGGNASSRAAPDVWIGPNAVLDVSGTFVAGTVLDGGTITLSAGTPTGAATIVVQPGAQLDLQGSEVLASSGLLQVANAGAREPRLVSETEWSNGGTLQLNAANVYFAGTVNAAGGAAQATGGTLTVGNGQVPTAVLSFVDIADRSAQGTLPTPAAVVVEPAGVIAANLPLVSATAFPRSGSDLSSTPSAFIPSASGAFIGTDTLSNSGFDSVTLTAGSIAFSGPVSVSLPGALTLNAGDTNAGGSGHFVLLPLASLPSGTAALLPSGVNPVNLTTFTPDCGAPGACTVNLNAGYVQMVGLDETTSRIAPNLTGGTLNVTAQWIDLERAIIVDNAANVNFTSTGPIRLLPENYGFIGSISGEQSSFGGALFVPGNLTLKAAEIYPVSNTQFLLASLGTVASDNALRIEQNGTPTAPLSAGGSIVLDAQTIEQDGTLWAPLGSIVIGLSTANQIPSAVGRLIFPPFVNTQNVTLGAGSLTSVSAAGLAIPDGFTIDGTTWYLGTPNGNPPNANNPATVVTAPPAKSVGIFGVNIATQPGAVVDLSGGGDIYATEFVLGNGGSRNVLTTFEQNPNSPGVFTPQYADGRQVYALVPTGNQPGVAAYDPTFADFPYYSGLSAVPVSNGAPGVNGIAPGSSITIAGGNGIPAGTYTLLPGMYATLPGAYRVVQVASNTNPTATASFTGADGSQYVSGTFSNALTGARSSQQSLFQLQSQAVWQSTVLADGQLQGRYSQINITSGTTFFQNQASTNGTPVPALPIDGGALTFGATGTLSLLSTNRFAPGTSTAGMQGAGGQVDIAANNMLILAADQTESAVDKTAGYLVLDADQVSNLGAASVVIGGTEVFSADGVTITAAAQNLEVLTDAAHPLTGPELILVTQVPPPASANVVNGLTVDVGSVIRAVGTVPSGTDRNITIGTLAVTDQSGNVISPAVSGDGALLRVSNGQTVTVTRISVPVNPAGQVSVGTVAGTTSLVAGASVAIAGAALTIDTSGTSVFAAASNGSPGVTLSAQNYDLSAHAINIGNPGGVSTTGLVLDAGLIANFAGATSVQLRSASVFNLFDAGGLSVGNPGNPVGTLTLDGAGLFSSQGGATTINATNVVLTDSQATSDISGAISGSTPGMLNVSAGGSVTQGTGVVALGNFGQVNVTAGQAIAFSGGGSVDAGAASVSLAAPVLLVNGGSTQSLTTTGALTIAQGAGTAPAMVATNIGGALTVTAASITDRGTIQALSGNVTLNATARCSTTPCTPGDNTGGVILGADALIDASGSHIAILDQVEDAPGGSVRLVSNTGNVTIERGAIVDVSATGIGYAGTVTIIAPDGEANLSGTLTGGAAFKDTGGNFALAANSLAGTLPFTGFTGSFTVTLQTGNIDVAAGTALSSGLVNLTANTGSVTVEGSIDASGSSGGSIALYGTAGVTINDNAVLNASYQGISDTRDPGWANGTSTLVQNGGTITLGTAGTPTGTYNATYGYENVAGSGAITVVGADATGPGAILNVGGGPGTTNVASNGGTISNNAGTIILRAPILEDGSVTVGFHGTVITSGSSGPNSGVVLNAYAVWSSTDTTTGAQHFDGIIDPAGWFADNGNRLPGTDQSGNPIMAPTPQSPLQSGQIFTVSSPNQDHVGFYQTTLVNFVQGFNTHADFSGAQVITASTGATALPASLQHSRPEIDLINPDPTINSGDITVVSNWNLGAGSQVDGGISLIYRTPTGEPGVLALRALNNVHIDATISDGFFFQQGTPDLASQAFTTELAKLSSYNAMFSGSQILYTCSPAVGGGGCTQLTQFTVNEMFGNYLPSQALLGPFSLQAPAVFSSGDPNQIAQYNQFYVQYITLFDAYQRYTTFDNLFYGVPSMPATGSLVPPAAPTAAGTYFNFSTGAVPGSGTDYVSLYEAYVQAVSARGGPNQGSGVFGNVNDQCAVCVAYAPPFAPISQLVPLQPGFPLPAAVPGNAIANNPAISNGAIFLNTTAAAGLLPPGSGGSFAYDFVAGAFFTGSGSLSVDPNAVVPVSGLTNAVTGNVTVDGHTSYTDTLASPAIAVNGKQLTIVVPTLVRTGTGSITITAAGNVELLDTVAPGAVYTAGAATATPADFTAPAVAAAYTNNPNGLLNTPAWATGGGAVTITAGQSIVGVETTIDNSQGSQTGVPNAPTGQLWSDWYYHSGLSTGGAMPFANCTSTSSCQTAAWVNYATFFQGFGALGGGNITLTAARDVVDVAASLPETVAVGGGTMVSDPPHASWFGGGNLVVNVGGNLLSSDFLVGRGTGLIQVGGSVVADAANPITGMPTVGIQVVNGTVQVNGTYALPLLLAAQDGFITVAARGSVTLGNVFDPASLPVPAGLLTNQGLFLPGAPGQSFTMNPVWSNVFTTFGPTSGVAVTSTNGDVTALTVPTGNEPVVLGLFVHNDKDSSLNELAGEIGQMLPSTIDLVSITGNINVNPPTPVNSNNNTVLSTSGADNVNLVPYPMQAGDDTGTITIVAAASINLGFGLAMPDLDTTLTQIIGNRSFVSANYVSPLGVAQPNLTQALHANDAVPVTIAAGKDIIGATATTAASLSLIKPAKIEAGHDIIAMIVNSNDNNSLSFVGENNNVRDITSIVAGDDLVGGSYVLYGPGTLLLQAGHDLGPFTPSSATGSVASGIATIGDGSAAVSLSERVGNVLTFKPWLPHQSAEIDVMFGVQGVQPVIDYAAAIAQFVNPANAGAGGIDFLTDIAKILGQSPDQAWLTFRQLPATQQHLLINRAFLDFLAQVTADGENPASAFFNQFGRAYQAIATLFPANLGYTDNAPSGGANGASVRVPTGNLSLAASVLETQIGGDINIIAPGGSITVGHTSLDTLTPSQQGVLTLGGGTIRAYTDSSILLNQSRIMTEQGGDIDLFTANGDISAGSGPKTFVSDPPITDICDFNGSCFVNPAGLVTGAGIAALVTLPGQDPANSNVTLAAPHGTIDAGAAGLRGNNITVAALQVLNSFNIQAMGTVTGIPFTPPPNVNGALSAQNTSGALQATVAAPAQSANTGGASVIIVEVVGYGGGDGGSSNPAPDEKKEHRSDIAPVYDPASTVQVVGFGPLSDTDVRSVMEEEH